MQKIEGHHKPIQIVVGGQYGSESKGLVVGYLAIKDRADFCVRTGSINAGHTVYHEGKKYVNQLIPVGWVNPKTQLILGAGVYIDPELLKVEIDMINSAMPEANVLDRLFIDKRCAVHLPSNYKEEHESKIHERMGSTGHGVMSAIVDKMHRKQEYRLFKDLSESQGFNIVDTVVMLNEGYDEGKQILIEGTQGTMLDFHLGFYPFVTTRQTVAANWLAECGLSPMLNTEVHMVIRTMPIRVAGNSGYMGQEVRWQDLATRINSTLISNGKAGIIDQSVVKKFALLENRLLTDTGFTGHPIDWSIGQRWDNSGFLSNYHNKIFNSMTNDEVIELRKFFEITTVTKKLRRIAELNNEDLFFAIMVNRPKYLHVNFLNYLYPTCWGVKSQKELVDSKEYSMIMGWLNMLADKHKICIQTINCSPDNVFEINGVGVTNI